MLQSFLLERNQEKLPFLIQLLARDTQFEDVVSVYLGMFLVPLGVRGGDGDVRLGIYGGEITRQVPMLPSAGL